jgi:hypothetical protein
MAGSDIPIRWGGNLRHLCRPVPIPPETMCCPPHHNKEQDVGHHMKCSALEWELVWGEGATVLRALHQVETQLICSS